MGISGSSWRRVRSGFTACCPLLLTGTAMAAGQNGGSWQQFHDPHYPFTLSYPAGWNVQVDDRHVLVQSADHATFAVIENFVPQDEETAEDHVDELPKTDAALFRQAKVNDAYTLGEAGKKPANGAATQGEQAVGALTYNGEHGPGQARVLCLVYPKGGLLFGLAAPNDRFATQQPVLLKILQSFQISATSPAAPTKSGTRVATTTPSDASKPVHYVSWTDPKEHAFSVEVPQLWSRDGGLFRASVLDGRTTLLVRSPQDEMAVMIGDAGVPSFNLPSQALQFTGHNEGSEIDGPGGIRSFIVHFMPATEFNHWYLENFLRKSVDNLEIGEDTEETDAGEKATASFAKMLPAGSPAQVTVTVARTRFSGRSKTNGRPMAGELLSTTTRFIGNARGDGNWTGRPSLYAWATDDTGAEARRKTAQSVFDHMNKTWTLNKTWVAEDKRHQQEFIAAFTRATQAFLRAQREKQVVMSRETVHSSDTRRESLMGSFKERMAAKDDMRRKQTNFSLDQTDVGNGSQSWKVAAGYSHYYRHEGTGAIVGTNDPNHPGVNFTALGQH